MKDFELQKKPSGSSATPTPVVSHPPAPEKLRAMTTNDLVKLLMNPEMNRPVNEAIRQQIIKLLQEREGNAFVQHLLGKESGWLSK